eukprot:scaffold64234_cov47-Attheya_sp.AAC.2
MAHVTSICRRCGGHVRISRLPVGDKPINGNESVLACLRNIKSYRSLDSLGVLRPLNLNLFPCGHCECTSSLSVPRYRYGTTSLSTNYCSSNSRERERQIG